MGRVLLTGGSGFIAAHVLDILLERGHSVVTTVRSKDKGDFLKKNHSKYGKDKFDYVIVEDIAKEDAFADAVKSDPPFDAVIHTASPFHFNIQNSVQEDLLDPAIIGTTDILKQIKQSAPNVKRVIITSSFASIVDGNKGSAPDHTYDEGDWNPITKEEATENAANGYRASKTFAEQESWDFVKNQKPNFSLAAMCPPLVLGPIVHYLNDLDKLNTSNQRVLNIIRGNAKEELPAGAPFLWVDVRDLALGHVLAMEKEDAGNKRFFITPGHFSTKEVVEIIRKNFPDLKDKLPSKDAPGGDYPDEGIYKIDNSRTEEVLGIKWTPLDKCITDLVKSLQEAGA